MMMIMQGNIARAAAHWAAPYVGKPWVRGAQGPEAWDCWGLVRHVQDTVYGRQMPALQIAAAPTAEQLEVLRDLMTSGPWHRVTDPAQGDVMLMTGTLGPHVGVVVRADRRLKVLHADGYRDDKGVDHGAVVVTPIERLHELGYGRLQAWRDP